NRTNHLPHIYHNTTDARRVNLPITNPQGKIHSGPRYSSRRTLIDSEAEDRHSHIIVQLDSRLEREIVHRRCHRISQLQCLKLKDSMTRLARVPSRTMKLHRCPRLPGLP